MPINTPDDEDAQAHGKDCCAGAPLRLASALLVRYSPGALVDERELDRRLNEQSLAAIRAEKAAGTGCGSGVSRYLTGCRTETWDIRNRARLPSRV